jgi:hypothetical protein
MYETITADQVIAALTRLRDVIATVRINGTPLGNAVTFEPGESVGYPIEVKIGPPAFNYRKHCLGPVSMDVDVFVVAITSDLTVHNMISLERGVADMVDASDEVDATVNNSAPGVWRRGSTDHPAYVINVTIGLP